MKKVTVITPLESEYQLDLMSGTMYITRYGTVSVATAIRDAGYDVKLFCEISGGKIDWDFVKSSDYVCFSLMSFNSHHGYRLAQKARSLTKAPIIFGGSHPSVLPQECLEYSDYVVINEGEQTVVDLLRSLDNGGNVKDVDGLYYKEEGEPVFTQKRRFIDNLHWPADFSLIEGYKHGGILKQAAGLLPGVRPGFQVAVIQTSRGCPRTCTFCFGKRELGNKYRKRKIEAIIAEITYIVESMNKYDFMIIDNDFCIDKKFTIEFLTQAQSRFKRKLNYWMFTRIETSRDREFVRKIRELGVQIVMLGIESVNDATLHFYKKKQNLKQITDSIDVFRREGIDVFSFFVLGAQTDTIETVRQTVDFAAKKAKFFLACFFILYDFPWQKERFGEVQIIDDDHFIHHDWRFYNSNFVVHYPEKIRPSVLQKEIIRCYKKFYSPLKLLKDLIMLRPQSLIYIQSAKTLLKTMKKYILLLEKIEAGMYDENDRLINEKLAERSEKPKVLAL